MQFSSNEKISCCGLYIVKDIMKNLEDSERNIFHLEFHYINFENSSESLNFWKVRGFKIESLHFAKCVLTEDVVKAIVVNCPNLKRLSVENQGPDGERFQKIFSSACLNELVRTQIRRETLNCLELKLYTNEMISDSSLRALFLIFPNVRRLLFDSSPEIFTKNISRMYID